MSASECLARWRRAACITGLSGLWLALCSAVFAQAPPTVSDANIERARQGQPVVTDRDIERAKQRHPAPSDADLARIAPPSTPRVDALPQPATRTPLDLAALARGFDLSSDAPAPTVTHGPSLMVFISLSMPEATLSRLVEQAARARASLLLRGLVNGSLRDTVKRVQGLIGSRSVSVQIDPQAFDRFSVLRTPSFVLLRSGAQALPCGAGQCFAADQYVLATGDVSLDYALEHFRRSSARVAHDAAPFLQRLKRRGG